ncbi:hypothetical protein HPB49_003100 [Dermacentor silvarum]|uniref:Uncharacterized protein n=1 Tax=Dermacentor silvarum TaxID=543639 RepID=A0ACB8DAA3_DERSI|nr:hypothetical protein HPB49_003100 [Dermacentor silvarum]
MKRVADNTSAAKEPKKDPAVAKTVEFAALKALAIGAKLHEISAYQSAPENSSKGVIKGIALEYTQKDRNDMTVNDRNLSVVAAKRTGNTNNVIVLLSGLKVPRLARFGGTFQQCYLYKKQIGVCYECGRVGHRADVCLHPNNKICLGCRTVKPTPDRKCKKECFFCGKDNLTGDKDCEARFKTPYLARRRRLQRKLQQQFESQYENTGANPRNRTPSRDRRGRSRIKTRSCTRSRSRTKSLGPPERNIPKQNLLFSNTVGALGSNPNQD